MNSTRGLWATSALVLVLLPAACTNSGQGTETTDADPAPSEAVTEEVSFSSGDVALEGDLRLPAGPGPHPGVVLVHGSGPIDRDSAVPGQLNMAFGFEVTVFADIADTLQGAGFAVLTYDKRTCGTFNGCADNDYPVPSTDITIDAFVEDAEAALGWLGDQSEVDGERLAVIGHSQGATLVPVLLDSMAQLRAGVMLAAPYDRVDAVLAEQAASTHELLAAAGVPSAEIDAIAEPVDAVAEEVAAIAAGTFEGVPSGGVTVGFWESWIQASVEAPAIAAGVTQPALVLSGDYDWNVPPHHTESWGGAFPATEVETTVVACVTHALNCLDTADPLTVTPADIGASVDAAVTEAVVAFLSENV